MSSLKERLSLAARNLFRHQARTVASLAAIVFGVASLIVAGGFVKDILAQLGEATIHSQTGHLQIAPHGFWESRTRTPENLRITDPSSVKRVISELNDVELVVARLNFTGTLNNGNRDLGILGDGIEPDGENRIGTFMRYIEGTPLSNQDLNGIVVGQGVAKALGLKIGDSVTLMLSLAQGALNTAEFRVIGIFQSFSKDFDARAVRIPLTTAQDLLESSTAHTIALTLHRTEKTEFIYDTIRNLPSFRGLDVKKWSQLSDFYEKTVDLYHAQFGVLRVIIFFMVVLSVANSINMTLFERTREFGTMRALGDNQNSVLVLIVLESLLLGVIGSILGATVGIIIALTISAIGIPMPPPPNSNIGYVAHVQLHWPTVLAGTATGIVATLAAAIYPAYKVGKSNIVDALRQGT